MKRQKRERGFSLPELLLVLAMVSLLALLTAPSLFSATSALRTRLAAAEITGALQAARSWAIRHSCKAAVKFHVAEDETVQWAVYVDGDGDGVRNVDIEAGVDYAAWPPRPLSHLGRHVGFGFPPYAEPRDPSNPNRRLDRLEDPIRFNNSDLASFDPLGTATPGSVYLTDGASQLLVVRVWGRTGRVRVKRWNEDEDRWE